MPAGILLAIAIASEVAATISLRYADGFSRPLPSTIVVLGYALSFWLLSLVLRDIPVGTTYAIWAGAGTAAIAVIGMAAARRARDRAEGRLDRADHPRRDRAQRLRRALMPRPSRRTALLDAALTVVRRDGAAALTLDAVAAEAGVSKGGLLYHFASKRALIDGLLERWLDEFGARLAGPGFAAAYVRASEVTGPENAASEFGMLAAMIEDPAVLGQVRERYAAWMDRMLEDVGDPVDAWLVRLAADGLWYSDLFGIAAPQGADRDRLIERLLALAAGGSK